MNYSKSDFIKTILKEGKWFFLIPLIVIIYLIMNSYLYSSFTYLDFLLLLLSLLVAAYTVFFLRPPTHFPTHDENSIYASADGYVISIEENIECPYLSGKFHKVVIFMHVASMHWNLSPIKGEITKEEFVKGKFKNAFSADKAWQDNEHQLLTIENHQNGLKVALVMVAGLIARRIRFFAKKGQNLEQGDVVGLIRYGSANVLYFPADFTINAKLKQKSRAGKTIIAMK